MQYVHLMMTAYVQQRPQNCLMNDNYCGPLIQAYVPVLKVDADLCRHCAEQYISEKSVDEYRQSWSEGRANADFVNQR